MAKFNVGDRVKKVDNTRLGGIVKGSACAAATKAGGKTCNYKSCTHQPQEHVWVDFGGMTYGYHETELELDAAAVQAAVEVKQQEDQKVLEKLSNQIDEAEKKLCVDDKPFDFKAYNSTMPGKTKPLPWFNS